MRNATQWRVADRGAYGLDYNVFYREIDKMKLSPEEDDHMMSAIRIIEDAALGQLHKD